VVFGGAGNDLPDVVVRRALDTRLRTSEDRSPCGSLEVNLGGDSRFLVLTEDGRVERFRVSGGDVAQAELTAARCQRPGDNLVVVTEHTYIRHSSSFPQPPVPRVANGHASLD